MTRGETIPLCATCGEFIADVRRCPHCDAAPPSWRRLPLSASNLVAGVGGVAGGVFCLGFAGAIVLLPEGSLGTFGRVVVALVTGALGVALLWGSVFAALLERDWTHPVEGADDATAVTRPGRVVRARGGGRTPGAPIAVPPNALRGAEAFAHYAALRRVVSKHAGVDTIAKVDGAVVAALLALAGRGRLELRLVRSFVWSKDGGRTSRHDQPQGVDVRPTGSRSPIELEITERALLDAVDPPAPTAAPAESVLPYRVAAALPPPVSASEWTPLPLVVLAVSRGASTFRRELRARLGVASTKAADVRGEGEVVAEFVATLDAVGGRAIAAALFHDVARGFEMRVPRA